MRKGIKILAKVLSAAVLLLLVLPIVLSLLLDISAVQQFVVRQVTQAVSRKLETTVHIDRIDIGLFNKVRVDGFYVEDYQRDTLLYAGRVDAFLTSMGLFGGGIVLRHGDIVDAKLYLRETPSGELNIKQIINRISNPDRKKKGTFHLTLQKASIQNMELRIERLTHRDPDYGIDFGNIRMHEMTAFVDDLTIDGSNVYTTIRTLTARERSGFVLDDFAGRFYLTSGALGFEKTFIRTARSRIDIPYISLAGSDWADYKEFIGEVRLDMALHDSYFSTDDIAYFAPKLRDWHLDFSNIEVELAGHVADFEGKILSMQIGAGTHLVADARITGLPDIDRTHFDLTIPQFVTTGADIDYLGVAVANRELSDKVVGILDNSGKIDIAARFKGMLSAFDMQVGATTKLGKVRCNLLIEPRANGLQTIRGDLASTDFKLGELLGQSALLGKATLSAHIDGVIGRGTTDAQIRGDVSKLVFRGYTYDAIRLDGHLRNRRFDGVVTARNRNLDFDFSGLVDLNDSIPRYDFTMELRHADLAKLHINRRDSISQLSARIEADARGRSLDDLNGEINITDAAYRYNDKSIASQRMTLRGENSTQRKLVEFRSDFADATFQSRTSYREVLEYLRRSMLRYLPLLRGDAALQDSMRRARAIAVVDDFSHLSVNIHHFDPVADAIVSGLQIADSSSLSLIFNPASDYLSLKARSTYIEQKNLLAARLNVNASTAGDSLIFYASAEDLYTGLLHLPNLSLTGGAKRGRVQVSAGFNDTTRHASGLLGVRAALVDGGGPNGPLVDVRILRSHLTRGDKTWQVSANKIQIDTARVVIDRFYVRNMGQNLFLTGVASRNRDDSLTLRLTNFDLATLTQFADRMGYAIEGRANGMATMKSVLGGGALTADIQLDSLAANDMAAPPLRLVSRWDLQNRRAGIRVIDRHKRDTLVSGFYAPSAQRYFARLNVDSLNMGLLDPILTGVIGQTRGLASADITLRGTGRDAKLAGEVRVADFSTRVDFTKVTYSMPHAVMRIDGNQFSAANVPVFDTEGHRGIFNIDLNLQHLSNIAYDVRIAPQQMLVLNTTSHDNDLFYGHVYATGNARIRGDKGSVDMDISAATDDNSSFVMPLSSKTNLSYADFVTFRQPAAQVDTNNDLALRKQQFERRQTRKSSAGSQMNITLALDVQPNVDVELSVAGNTIRGRGEGTLNLTVQPRSNVFDLVGDYRISEGSFMLTLQNIINKRFAIESGSSIQWTGPPMDALLNIDAVYKLKASLQPLLQSSAGGLDANRSVPVECGIHLGERLSSPSITFDVRVPGADPEMQAVVANALSSPETVDTQFAYLLLFNSFMSENSASGMGASVSAATGFELLSNMVSNFISGDGYGVILRYRPKSELTSDEIDFGLSQSLINDRLLVEVEGNYVVDNKQAVNSGMSNFMGEAYITYLIDKGGALRLRVFTQTIDRFDENQGLQETGVGIYFKEDFENFPDLRRRVKERFTNKRRQARKQAREEAARREADREAALHEDAAGLEKRKQDKANLNDNVL